ncbi:MAG TPA: hypothetical protein VJP02_28140 [Candidatus Sulfotelmatobacter sp.]|nr:hypothetical protein [Candidatus Sulfotelmatobacter sp.]
MKNKWTRLLLCVVVIGLTSAWALAQDDTSNKSKGEVRNLTGCLTKSGGGNEYLLTATDGSTWEIHENSSVDLASHVNQTVELRGVVSNEKAHNMKEDAKDMASDTGATKHKAEHGHLKATSLHKMSDSCQ